MNCTTSSRRLVTTALPVLQFVCFQLMPLSCSCRQITFGAFSPDPSASTMTPSKYWTSRVVWNVRIIGSGHVAHGGTGQLGGQGSGGIRCTNQRAIIPLAKTVYRSVPSEYHGHGFYFRNPQNLIIFRPYRRPIQIPVSFPE